MGRQSAERLVRPFEQGKVFNGRTLTPERLPAGDESIITWAGSANADYAEEPAPVFTGLDVEWQEDSSKRFTETVRVENPDNPNQYVDVERIEETTFVNMITGEQIKLKMDWS